MNAEELLAQAAALELEEKKPKPKPKPDPAIDRFIWQPGDITIIKE